MQFFILAGGYGTRAKPLSLIKPKCLFPIAGKPLLALLLEQLQKKGIFKGFINLHYLPDQIQCLTNTFSKTKTIYIYEEVLSGSQILHAAAPALEDILLIINGDLYMDIPIEKMLTQLEGNSADGVLLVRRSNDVNYSNVLTKGELFAGKKPGEPGDKLMYTGVAMFRKNVVRAIKDISFFSTLARHSFKIMVQEHKGVWLDIGDPPLYYDAEMSYRELMRMKGTNSLSENVSISRNSNVSASIIWENTIIDNHSQLENCIVTGDVSINRSKFKNKIITGNGVYNLFPVT